MSAKDMCACWGIYRLWTHQKGVTGVCDGGAHTKKQQRIRVKMGCERRPRAPVCDYTGSDLALFMGLWRM